MFKKLITVSLVLTALLAVPSFALADEQETQTCVSVYGGGVVCGAKAPEEHQPVKAGLGDNLAVVAGILLLSSGVFAYLSKKAKLNSFESI